MCIIHPALSNINVPVLGAWSQHQKEVLRKDMLCKNLLGTIMRSDTRGLPTGCWMRACSATGPRCLPLHGHQPVYKLNSSFPFSWHGAATASKVYGMKVPWALDWMEKLNAESVCSCCTALLTSWKHQPQPTASTLSTPESELTMWEELRGMDVSQAHEAEFRV